jgi:hypothetical protein
MSHSSPPVSKKSNCRTGCNKHHAVRSVGWSPMVRLAPMLSAAALTLMVSAVSNVWAQAADPSDIAEGGRLFRQKANCQACHGWPGDGRKMDNQMPDGANLRETTLDRQNLVMTIKCGRPGTGMPAFDRFAYSDGRCYGLKQADLRSSGKQMPDPPATLQPREVETLADFLVAKVVQKGPMDHAKCIDYWGSEVEVCKEEFPK